MYSLQPVIYEWTLPAFFAVALTVAVGVGIGCYLILGGNPKQDRIMLGFVVACLTGLFGLASVHEGIHPNTKVDASRIDSDAMHVVYAVPEGHLIFPASPEVVYPQKTTLYKN